MNSLKGIRPDRPVLIAGPTASGKSALALALAQRDGRDVVNADAIQVFGNWRVLTARPSSDDEKRARHRLYGHVSGDAEYSVGAWLREIAPLVDLNPPPVIVGGTGLYFSALTEGLADIPTVPADIRNEAADRLERHGLPALLNELDALTRARIDIANTARVLRAWEVLRATGEGLAVWQERPAPPVLDLSDCYTLVVNAPRDWLMPRIANRFDTMLDGGAVDEARRNLPCWNTRWQSSRAIGAAELIRYLRGEITLDTAREQTLIATRQYAKRQRTWFRARMRDWHRIDAETLSVSVSQLYNE
ncbi:MAG: tRNA (adenosine(37)-N6)-dimethylallyltransferase MiaA [Pseudomonadota bacterium]